MIRCVCVASISGLAQRRTPARPCRLRCHWYALLRRDRPPVPANLPRGGLSLIPIAVVLLVRPAMIITVMPSHCILPVDFASNALRIPGRIPDFAAPIVGRYVLQRRHKQGKVGAVPA